MKLKLNEFTKLKTQIDQLLKKAEEEALENGDNISSASSVSALKRMKEALLKDRGIDSKEYELLEVSANQNPDDIDKEKFVEFAEKINDKFDDTDVSFNKKNKELLKEMENQKESILSESDIKKIILPLIPEIPELPKIPKQLTKEDIEAIVRPLIPKTPKILEQKTFNQNDIKRLRADQIDLEVISKKDLEILKQEMTEYTNKMAVARSGGGGNNTGKGSRFANKGAPDRHGYSDAGSFGTAIPDDRYALKGTTGATFVDDETPGGTKDGSNLTFTLAYTPISGSVKLFLGGTRLEVTNDFSISGTTITMIFAPEAAETFLADYRR